MDSAASLWGVAEAEARQIDKIMDRRIEAAVPEARAALAEQRDRIVRLWEEICLWLFDGRPLDAPAAAQEQCNRTMWHLIEKWERGDRKTGWPDTARAAGICQIDRRLASHLRQLGIEPFRADIEARKKAS